MENFIAITQYLQMVIDKFLFFIFQENLLRSQKPTNTTQHNNYVNETMIHKPANKS